MLRRSFCTIDVPFETRPRDVDPSKAGRGIPRRRPWDRESTWAASTFEVSSDKLAVPGQQQILWLYISPNPASSMNAVHQLIELGSKSKPWRIRTNAVVLVP